MDVGSSEGEDREVVRLFLHVLDFWHRNAAHYNRCKQSALSRPYVNRSCERCSWACAHKYSLKYSFIPLIMPLQELTVTDETLRSQKEAGRICAIDPRRVSRLSRRD